MTRQLDATEVRTEAGKIRNEKLWPLWPVLPLKNIYRRGNTGTDLPQLGVLTSGRLTLVYITDMYSAAVPGCLDTCKKESFASVEDMVRAGWVGD